LIFVTGIDLIRVEIIPDDVETIATTVKKMSELVNDNGFVFTTGGIGPTHDDLTYEGVVRRHIRSHTYSDADFGSLVQARAFEQRLVYHEPTVEAMRQHFRKSSQASSIGTSVNAPVELNEARLRMALLPEGCAYMHTNSIQHTS
jgi:molybdopterin-biosynthesis enzyme MoeA-like protein